VSVNAKKRLIFLDHLSHSDASDVHHADAHATADLWFESFIKLGSDIDGGIAGWAVKVEYAALHTLNLRCHSPNDLSELLLRGFAGAFPRSRVGPSGCDHLVVVLYPHHFILRVLHNRG